jgi:hypothetical protein
MKTVQCCRAWLALRSPTTGTALESLPVNGRGSPNERETLLDGISRLLAMVVGVYDSISTYQPDFLRRRVRSVQQWVTRQKIRIEGGLSSGILGPRNIGKMSTTT